MKLQKKVTDENGTTEKTYNVEEYFDTLEGIEKIKIDGRDVIKFPKDIQVEYVKANRLQTTTLQLGSKSTRIAVLHNGWIYSRTPTEIWGDIKPNGGIPASDLAFIPVTNKQINNKLLIDTSENNEVTINGSLGATNILSAPLVSANALIISQGNSSDSLTITGLNSLKNTLGLTYSEPFNITWEDNIVAADTDSYHRVFYSRYYPALKMCFIHAEFRPKTDAVFGASGTEGYSRRIFTLTQKNGYSFQLRPEHEQAITTYCYTRATNGKIRKGTGTGDTENENNIYGYLHTTTPPLTTTSTIFINGFWSVEETN